MSASSSGVRARDDPHGVALFLLRVQALGVSVHVAGDHVFGRVENGLRRAVVPLEENGSCAGVVLLELQDVAHGRAAPPVDALVGVADRREVPGRSEEQAKQLRLDDVGVLVLVDQHVREPLPVVRAGFLVLGEQASPLEEEVVEVEEVAGLEPLRVAPGHALEERLHVAIGEIERRLASRRRSSRARSWRRSRRA